MSRSPAGPEGDPPQLRTPRLRLRRFVEADVPALVEALDDAEIAANTLTVPHPYGERDARAFLARVDEGIARGLSAVFALCDLESGALVGAGGLHLDPPHERAELGFWIHRRWRGRGLAREAVGALLDHAFGPMGLGRVYAAHYPWNPASGRVLAAAGLRPEGTLRGHYLKGGRRIDAVTFGILREEHLARRTAQRDQGGADAGPRARLEP